MSTLIKYIIFSLTVFILGCNNEKLENDLKDEKLFGRVKSVKESFFPNPIEKFGKIENGVPAVTTQYFYDLDGNKTEGNVFGSDGILSRKILYKYEHGKKSEINYYSENGTIDSREIFRYDDKLRSNESDEYSSEGSLKFKWTNKVDESGNNIESIKYNPGGDLFVRWVYKYDKNNNLIEELIYEANGKLISQENSKYDSDNFLIEQTSWKSFNNSSVKVMFINDKIGNVVKTIYYNNEGILDPSNNRIYKYEYDSHNNWIKNTCIMGKFIQSIYTREIEYY